MRHLAFFHASIFTLTAAMIAAGSLAAAETVLVEAESFGKLGGWVVDQQLIPRIREAFSRTDIAIPGDRILTFYHVKREQRVRGPKDRLRSFARTRQQK